jgi:hypothetical protein
MDETNLRRVINAYQVSQALHVAATLRIADRLGEGARSVEELAAETDTHAPSLYRLLRALASVGVFHEDDHRRFSLTPLGDELRSDGLGAWAEFVGRPHHWQAWGALLHSVRTGENAFRQVHGVDVWQFRAERPEESALFDRAMTSLTRGVIAAVLDAYDFGRFGTVVDVGGGSGAFLAALLDRHPAMQGVLFDQPHVVEGAVVPERCRVVAGSFFEAVPDGGDAYVLKSVIHDWEDEEAVAILRTCRRAVPADGVVLLVERELGPPNSGADGKFLDLTMLTNAGGRERTLDEYAMLFERAGFRLAGATPSASGFSVIEAAPA